MKAALYTRYGGPEVISVATTETPTPKEGELLVKVAASSVTTADWRLRASAFPGATWLPGRLMFGLFAPRKPILGGDFAGTVVAVGKGVTDFAAGDRVFGYSMLGAHAEYLTIAANGAVAHRLPDQTAHEAAALPFGGIAALVFLRDVAALQAGQRVLIVGGTGGVGAYAIQIAKALGAHVTAIAGPDRAAMMHRLGADETRDYSVDAYLDEGQRYDAIFDTVGALNFPQARKILTPTGVFVPLNFGLSDALQALAAKLRGGPRIKLAVNGDAKSDLLALRELVEQGKLRAVIDRIYPLDYIAEAHGYVAGRHRQGAVVVDIAPDAATLSDAA